MKYALIDGTTIIQTLKASYTPESPWVQVPAAAEPGGTWDGSTYTAPVPADPEPRMRLSVREFREQFTAAEKTAIYTAAKSSVEIEVWLDDLRSVTYVDLDFPQTIASVQGLESAGLIGAGRADEILSGVTD